LEHLNMRFRLPIVTLGLLSVVLLYAVASYGAVDPQTVNFSLLALAVVGVLYGLLVPGEDWAPSMPIGLSVLTAAVPVYVAFQLLPLPISWIGATSQARAELARSLTYAGFPAAGTPIAINPSATLSSLCKVLAYLLIFLLVRQVVWRTAERPWIAAFPIFTIGIAEALAGLLQCHVMGHACDFASGTYVNRNHFAGLLEMCFPFALIYPFFLSSKSGNAAGSSESSATQHLKIGVLLLGAVIIVIAVVASLSRTGAAIVVLSLVSLLAAYATRTLPSRWKVVGVLGLFVLLLATSLIAVPGELIQRFSELGKPQAAAMDRRMMWKQTVLLIKDYPLFGCGLGGYASAYLKYKTGMPLWSTFFAHNDYLQGMAEVGSVGSLLFGGFIALVLAPLLRLCRAGGDKAIQTLALACATAILAMLIHSLVDFNFYIPANVMTFVWICGVAATLPSLKERAASRLQVPDVEVDCV
jgi:O-antigen ligase